MEWNLTCINWLIIQFGILLLSEVRSLFTLGTGFRFWYGKLRSLKNSVIYKQKILKVVGSMRVFFVLFEFK